MIISFGTPRDIDQDPPEIHRYCSNALPVTTTSSGWAPPWPQAGAFVRSGCADRPWHRRRNPESWSVILTPRICRIRRSTSRAGTFVSPYARPAPRPIGRTLTSRSVTARPKHQALPPSSRCQVFAWPRSNCAPSARQMTEPELQMPGRTQILCSPVPAAHPMSRGTSTGIRRPLPESQGPLHQSPWHPAHVRLSPGRARRASPGRHADPSAQPDRHDDGNLQRGPDSQDQDRAQAARQEARWL